MRVECFVDKVPVLAAIAVAAESGRRTVPGLKGEAKESVSIRRELLRDLERWGLNGSADMAGMADDLGGFERVFLGELPHGTARRSQLHVAQMVLVKVPGKLKKAPRGEIRTMFCLFQEEGPGVFNQFKAKPEEEDPLSAKVS